VAEALGPVFRGPKLPTDLGPQFGPLLSRDQIRLGIGVPAAPLEPPVARPQGAPQLPEYAQLEGVAASRRVGVVGDVGPPPRGDELEGRLLGEDAAVLRVELPEPVHGPEQGRIAAGAEREGVEELGGELSEVGVAALQEIEIVVIEGPDDPVGLLDGGPEFRRRDAAVDGSAQVGVSDPGIEHHPADLAEELDLLVGRAGHRQAELLEVATGPVVGLGEAAIEQVEGLVGQIDQGLVKEGDQDRVAPLLGHSLEGLVGGPTGDLGEELPRQIPASRYSKPLLGMDFSGLYDYDGFRERRQEGPHAHRLCPGVHRRAVARPPA
jgi:hypothetical protein